MKRIVALLLTFVLMASFAFAESIELSAYTDEDLMALRNKIDAELNQRKRANQEGTPVSDFLYASDGKEVCINAYIGPGGDVVIPETIDGCKVTKIAEKAFYDNGDLVTSLVLPSTIRYIGGSQFKRKSKLTGVLILPEELEEVGSHAFQTTAITGLVIQSDCTIKLNAFANLSSLEFIYIKEGCAPSIPKKSTFSYGKVLKVCIIPSSVKTIADETFDACNYMTIITPAGSYAEDYARRNFIVCDTDTYSQYVEEYSSKY